MGFWDPLYNKIAFLRPPYTKKWHFRDSPIQQNGIFKTPYTKKCNLETPLYKQLHFGTPLYNKFSRFDPLYKNGQNLTPRKRMTEIWPPYTKMPKIWPPIQKRAKIWHPYTKRAKIWSPHTKNAKIWPPLYNKIFALYTKWITPYTKWITPYTKEWHLRDPLYKNGIFETPLYNKIAFSRPPIQKMAFSRPPIQQNGIFETPYTKNLHFRDPLYKKLPSAPLPIFKWNSPYPVCSCVSWIWCWYICPFSCTTSIFITLLPLSNNACRSAESKQQKHTLLYDPFQTTLYILLIIFNKPYTIISSALYSRIQNLFDKDFWISPCIYIRKIVTTNRIAASSWYRRYLFSYWFS